MVLVFVFLSGLVASASASADCGWPAANAFCNGPQSNFLPGIGYPKAGSTRTQGPITNSAAVCCCACAANRNCNGWTLNHGDGNQCFLKTEAGPDKEEKDSHAISGLMPVRPPPPCVYFMFVSAYCPWQN